MRRLTFAFGAVLSLAASPRTPAAQQLTPDQLDWLRGHAKDEPLTGGGWDRRAEAVRLERARLAQTGRLAGISQSDAVRAGAALTGTLHVLTLASVYSDVPAPFPVADLHDAIFGSGGTDAVSASEYYDEVSHGLLTITGEVTDWITLDNPAAYYLDEADYGWAERGRFDEFLNSLFLNADPLVDFGEFDNDGPDGIPNSGDDDGVVDLLVILYATDCNGAWRNGWIWPGGGGVSRNTEDPAANGGTIWTGPAVFMNAQRSNVCAPIYSGVLVHEIGHAFGLPDLYDYDFSSNGIGYWGLMGYGLYQKENAPAYLSAWSRERLGWITVLDSLDLVTLEPAETGHVAYRHSVPDTDQYFLIENRRRFGTDMHLPGEGVLIWHIDPGNSMRDESHPLVDLEQADGSDFLNNYGDWGDPFPGSTQNRLFGHTTLPSSSLYEGRSSGLEAIGFTAVEGGFVRFYVGQWLAANDSATGLAGAAGDERQFAITVTPGARVIWAQLTNGTGNVTLEIASIDSTAPACVGRPVGSAVECVVPDPKPGNWRLVVRGNTDFSGMSLSWRTDHPGPVAALSRPAISDTLVSGESQRPLSVLLKNVGHAVLNWEVGALPRWLTVSPTRGSIEVDGFEVVDVTVLGDSLPAGEHHYVVDLTGNAANAPLGLPVDLNVIASFSQTDLAAAVLGQRQLTQSQIEYLDRLGNRNGLVDLGDLLAWVEERRQ